MSNRRNPVKLYYIYIYIYIHIITNIGANVGLQHRGCALREAVYRGGPPGRPPGVDFHHGVPAGGGGAENAAFSTV